MPSLYAKNEKAAKKEKISDDLFPRQPIER